MITATAKGDDGKQIIVLGITRSNVQRLLGGQPIRVTAETHAGFPSDLSIVIFFGENERAVAKQLKPLIGESTKIITVPKDPGGIS